MQSISSDLIFDGYKFLEKDSALELDENGKIISITKKNENTISFKGILIPGFINCHCHLELSFLKNEIPEKEGLVNFIKQIVSKRNQSAAEFIEEKIVAAEKEMIKNGIVAVGDISNGLDTLNIKKQHNLYYHTFVECFGLDKTFAGKIIEKAIEIKNEFTKISSSSVVLHAPYSITNQLIEKVIVESKNEISTIHNRETKSENELFENGTGDLKDFFTNVFPNTPTWLATHKTSLQNYFHHFSTFKNSILVHNTFTSKADIEFAKTIATNTFWCLCPNANLYIEDTLPNAELLYNENCQVVFGTDSLASNHSLNIFDEMMMIKNKFPQIPFEKLLQSITTIGAKALGIENQFGSFEIGKTPGINLVSNYENRKIFEIKKLY